MKTVLLSLFALTMAHLSYAQINKGALLIGAGFNFNYSDYISENKINNQIHTAESNSTIFGFSPSIGYFTSNNFMVGLGLGYQFSNDKTNSANQDNGEFIRNSHTFSVSPYLKKYMEISDKLYFTVFAGVSAGMGQSKNENDGIGIDEKSDFYNVRASIAPGLSYFLNSKWALFANYGSLYYHFNHNINYQNNSSAVGTTSNTNTFGATLSLNSFDLGIQYFLRNE